MKKIKVIMAGSGALYPIYLGSLLKLKESGYDIVEIAGTSGGAIASCVWSLSDIEINKENLVELISKTLPSNNKNMIKYSLFTFFSKWGLSSGNKIQEMFDSIFYPTLSQSKIPIKIYASNVNKDSEIVFSSQTHPNLSTSLVLRASCSIPFIFDPVKIEDVLCVDGGWTHYFPLDCFSVEENELLFCMRIGEAKENKVIRNIYEYMQKIMYSKIKNKFAISSIPEYVKIIDFKSKYDRTKLATTTEDQALKMFEEGYDQTQQFLDNLNR